MFSNGLAAAQYDELHSYEDGLNVLGPGADAGLRQPEAVGAAMVTAKRLEWLTGLNSAGQRQIRSSYYIGTKMAEGGVWGWAKSRSHYVFHSALQLPGDVEHQASALEVLDVFTPYREDYAPPAV